MQGTGIFGIPDAAGTFSDLIGWNGRIHCGSLARKKRMNVTEIPKILSLEILFAVDSSSDFVTDFIIQQQIDILISLLFQDEHKKQNFNSILHHAL